MTVVNHPARNQYTAVAAQTVFSYVFEIESQDNILVYKRAAGSTADDVADKLILTTDYTVTGVGTNNGGTIVLVNPATAGDIVTIQADAPAERDTAFSQGGVIQASNLNLEFDNDVLIYQTILATLNSLVPKYPKSAYVQDFDVILPQLAANESWMMNAAGNEIVTEEFITVATLGSPIGASMVGLNPTGTVQDMADQKFILQVASPTMPNAQSLGALGSGVLKSATGSGVVSISNSLTSLDSLSIAADQMAYGSGANTWSLTALTAYSRTLLAQANSTGWLATLGAPSLAQAFLVSNNLSEGVGATKRANLGLTIGTDVQAYDATLQSLSALGTAANKVAYTTGVDTWAEVTATAYSRGLWAGVDLAAWQVALGIPGGGGAYFAIANNLSEGVPATIRSNIGLVIGTDVQAYDATLQSLSALGTMSDKIAYTTGVDTWAETGITTLGRALIDDATQADMNTTIGSVPLAGGTMTGALYLSGSPTLGSQAATKDYVDSLSLNDEIACLCMTETDQLAAWTYNNGVLGVGATITANINGATIFDGVTPVDTNRVLVNLQTANEEWQGAYTIVQGTGGTPTVLTRATDYDVPGEISAGDVFAVVQGTLYGASQWMNSQIISPVVIGTTPITFTQLAGMGALLKANNLSDLPSAATARTNLGLVIGTNVQAYDATLQSISGLGTAANKMIYTTALDTWAEADITALGRTLLADATAADMRITTGSAASGANTDITSLGGLTGIIKAPTAIQSSAGISVLEFLYTASATDWLQIQNGLSGAGFQIISSNANASIGISAKGTGGVLIGSAGATTIPMELQVGSYKFTFSVPSLTATRILTLPDQDIDLTPATQAQQETATSTSVFITPARQQYHPSSAKGWVRATFAGTSNASYNVTSITDNGPGQFTINWATDFSSANYCSVATCVLTPGGTAGTTTITQVANDQAAGTTHLYSIECAGYSAADSNYIHCVAFGDQ